ncbi:hypothetical protein EniLVp02_0168 [Vibrio phage EniLVp02]
MSGQYHSGGQVGSSRITFQPILYLASRSVSTLKHLFYPMNLVYHQILVSTQNSENNLKNFSIIPCLPSDYKII